MNKLVVNLNSLQELEKFDNLETIEAYILGNQKYSINTSLNSSISNIKEVASKTNKKIFIAINKIIHQKELKELKEYIVSLMDLGIDSIIFSDFAIYNIVKELKFDVNLIYSTDTTITNSYFSPFLANQGVETIDLAKEITLDEAKVINENKKSKVMFFIHGNIFMYNSYRKLISAYKNNFNKEEINTGDELFLYDQERENYYPIIEDIQGTKILSAQDQVSLKYFYDILQIKNDYLKIDSYGYMVDDFYKVVKIYNDLILDFENGVEEQEFKEKSLKELEKLKKDISYKKFSYGFLKKRTTF